MKRFLFIGERRSKTAVERGWTWESGRLAAKSLFDGLRACGLNPLDHCYGNWFEWDLLERCNKLNQARRMNLIIVAMGKKVDRELTDLKVEHLSIYHPAARGIRRRKDFYAAHLKSIL